MTEEQNISDKEEQQIYIAIEKYLSLMMIEFKDHISKYKNFYENVLKYLKCRCVEIVRIILCCLSR